jgi:surface protein
VVEDYGHLSSWNVSQVSTMRSIFENFASFDGDVSSWDVSKVTAMEKAFKGASSFNGDLSRWDVSQVVSMQSMFHSASSFNGDLSSWDVSQVTTMQSMFEDATSFNGAWFGCSDADVVYQTNGDFSSDFISETTGFVEMNPYGWETSTGNITIVRNGNAQWGGLHSGADGNFVSISGTGAALKQTLRLPQSAASSTYLVTFVCTYRPGHGDNQPLRVKVDPAPHGTDENTIWEHHPAVSNQLPSQPSPGCSLFLKSTDMRRTMPDSECLHL